jgi:hypothetical protein
VRRAVGSPTYERIVRLLEQFFGLLALKPAQFRDRKVG